MATFFATLNGSIADVAEFAGKVENDVLRFFNPKTLAKLMGAVEKEGIDELERMFTHLVKLHFPGIEDERDVPAILTALRDRHIGRWSRTLANAGATATDSVPEYQNPVRAKMKDGSRKSILARLDRELGGSGDEPLPDEVVQEVTQHFLHAKGMFDVMRLLPKLRGRPAVDIPVASIRKQKVTHKERISQATLRHPIVLYKEGGSYTIVDGRHRLAKQMLSGAKAVKAIIITDEDLAAVLLKPGARAKFGNITTLAGRKLYGVVRADRKKTRKILIRLVPYLKLLQRNTPRNFERDFKLLVLKLQRERQTKMLVLISPGRQANTCRTCVALNGRVLTEDALRFAMSSLKPQLFHPNCRHRLLTGGLHGITMDGYDPSTHGEVITLPRLHRMVAAGMVDKQAARTPFVSV